MIVLVNGAAGSEPGDAARVKALFAAAGIDAAVEAVAGGMLQERARRALDSGCQTIVAGGGDGTVSGVANVLVGTRATLGVLPLGTLNHFAKDLQIPLDAEGAVRTIAAGVTRRVDVGEVNGRYFVNNSSIGAYPRIVNERERRRRRGRPKWLAHALAAVEVWNGDRHLRVVLRAGAGRRVVETPFVFVGNNEYHLEGLELGARDRLNAGVLHLCLAPGMTRVGLARAIGAALLGRLGRVEGLESHLPQELSIEGSARALLVSFDGEVATLPVPLAYRSVPAALLVLAPAPGMPLASDG